MRTNKNMTIIRHNTIISVRDKRGRFSYKLPEREKPISARMLGAAYDRDYLLSLFADNAKGIHREKKADKAHTTFTAPKQTEDIPQNPQYTASGIRLLVDLENCIKAQQNRAYAQKVKITNLQQMAQTYAFVQRHGYGSDLTLKICIITAKIYARIYANFGGDFLFDASCFNVIFQYERNRVIVFCVNRRV